MKETIHFSLNDKTNVKGKDEPKGTRIATLIVEHPAVNANWFADALRGGKLEATTVPDNAPKPDKSGAKSEGDEKKPKPDKTAKPDKSGAKSEGDEKKPEKKD